MTVASDMARMFGPVKRWREGDILFAENDFLRMAYIVTNEDWKIGTLGCVPYKDSEMFVEHISADKGKLWDA